MSRMYNVSDSAVCSAELQAEGDPMGDGQAPRSAASQAIEQASRQNTDAWNVNRDANMSELRGRS